MGETIILVLGLATAVAGLAKAVVELVSAALSTHPHKKRDRKRG